MGDDLLLKESQIELVYVIYVRYHENATFMTQILCYFLSDHARLQVCQLLLLTGVSHFCLNLPHQHNTTQHIRTMTLSHQTLFHLSV